MPKVCSKVQRAGFTLIELLVASAILAILISVVVVSFRQANAVARDAKRKADLQEIRGILENYRLENGQYPASQNEAGGYEVSSDGTFLENVGVEYVAKTYVDPINNATYHYRYQLRNLPGCTYELSVLTEAENGQSCTPCGTLGPNYYCLTD